MSLRVSGKEVRNPSFILAFPDHNSNLANKPVALYAGGPDAVVAGTAARAALVYMPLDAVWVDRAGAAELALDPVATASGGGASTCVERSGLGSLRSTRRNLGGLSSPGSSSSMAGKYDEGSGGDREELHCWTRR